MNPMPVRIAISGGGLAGAALIHALHDKTNLDVHIFESAETFREAGAAVGVMQNGQRALELISPSASRALSAAGAVPLREVHWMMARGREVGTRIGAINGKDEPVTNIVHRAEFLRELLAAVPSSRMHASKQLVKLEQRAGDVMMSFSDGTSHACDNVVGADGVHSFVRRYLLGEADPAAHPVPAGWWFNQNLRSYEEARPVLGDQYVDLDHPIEYDFAGEGAFWMHNVLSKGRLVQSIICVRCDGDTTQTCWRKSIPADDIRRIYQNWPDVIREGVDKLICDAPEVTAMYLWEHQAARTYSEGSICVMGDAAHAMTPWQSSGIGMSLEDALILSVPLGRASSTNDANEALRIYDKFRRPRTQNVVRSSHDTGLILTGTKAEFAMYDLDQMRENLPRRWDFIREFDLEKHRDGAIAEMDALLKRTS